MMKARILIMCAAVILLTAMPAAAQVDPRTIPIWVGGNIDVHNNTGQVAHDFHLEGYVKHSQVDPSNPTEPSGPIQIGYINRGGVAVPFPNATNTKTQVGPDLWKVTADWSSLDVNPSEVGHFGLFYDVTCRNVWLKFDAWWTDTAGNRLNSAVGGVGWPVLGFEVPSEFSDALDPPPALEDQPVFRLHGDSGEEAIDTEIVALELMSMTRDEAATLGGMEEVFRMLSAEKADALNRWTALPEISEDNPMDFPADSFFDVFYEIDLPGVALGDGDLLLARTLARWSDEPAGRWFFHAHQNHVPEPATLCLVGLGALAVLRRRRR